MTSITDGSAEKKLLGTMVKNLAELQQYIATLEQMLVERQEDPGWKSGLERLTLPNDREERLQSVIIEAIDELEESRKSFKSKRLEQLRRKMTLALLDAK